MKNLEDRLHMLADTPGTDLRETLKVILDTSIAMTDVARSALEGQMPAEYTPVVSREEYLVGLIKEMLPDVRLQMERASRYNASTETMVDYVRLIRAAEVEIEFQAKKSKKS